MRSLKPLQFIHQFVKVGIGKFWIIEHVVAVFVVADLLAQGFDLFSDFLVGAGAGHGWEIIVRVKSELTDQDCAKGQEDFRRAFLIRSRPIALLVTLEGGLGIPSSNSFNTCLLYTSPS